MDRRTALGLSPKSARAGAAPSGGSASANAWIPLQTLTASIVRGDGRRGVMTVEAGVNVTDTALRTRAQQSTPRLRAALATVVQRTGASLLPGAPPDIDRLGRELQAAVDQTLGRAGARLLLGTVISG